jgi:hypothetical protein
MSFDGQLYTLDLSRTEAFDKGRHDIVHGLDLKPSGPAGLDCEQEVFYWEWTCFYRANMVAYRYNIQMDVDAIRRQLRNWHSLLEPYLRSNTIVRPKRTPLYCLLPNN